MPLRPVSIVAPRPTPSLTLDAIAAVGLDPETGAYTVLRFGR